MLLSEHAPYSYRGLHLFWSVHAGSISMVGSVLLLCYALQRYYRCVSRGVLSPGARMLFRLVGLFIHARQALPQVLSTPNSEFGRLRRENRTLRVQVVLIYGFWYP